MATAFGPHPANETLLILSHECLFISLFFQICLFRDYVSFHFVIFLAGSLSYQLGNLLNCLLFIDGEPGGESHD